VIVVNLSRLLVVSARGPNQGFTANSASTVLSVEQIEQLPLGESVFTFDRIEPKLDAIRLPPGFDLRIPFGRSVVLPQLGFEALLAAPLVSVFTAPIGGECR
jgi:hypothetical protein